MKEGDYRRTNARKKDEEQEKDKRRPVFNQMFG